MTLLNTTYTPNANLDKQCTSVESLNFSELPDEYFEQFHSGCEPPSPEKPEESLSVQMFFAPESDEEDDKVVIQLSDFLHRPQPNEESHQANYANIRTNEYISHADLPKNVITGTSSDDTSSPSVYGDYLIHTSMDANSGPNSDYYSGSSSGSQPNTSDYLVHTSIIQPNLGVSVNSPSTHSSIEELSGPPSPTLKGYEENSSGDSGYISPADVIKARELAHAASLLDVETGM